MQPSLRLFLIVTVFGILAGIITAIDPILPATKLVTSSIILRAINPFLIFLRFLIWSGVVAAIGGVFIGYRQRKMDSTTKSLGKAVTLGWSIWVAVASYFASIVAIVITNVGLGNVWLQQLNNQFIAGGVGFGPEMTAERFKSSMGIFTLVVVFILGVYNMCISVGASWIGSLMARR